MYEGRDKLGIYTGRRQISSSARSYSYQRRDEYQDFSDYVGDRRYGRRRGICSEKISVGWRAVVWKKNRMNA
jgi:hypothetical protein